MNIKNIERVVSPPPHHFVGDGFRVHNFIPSIFSMERMSPFIMMDYNSKHIFPATDKPRGVGVHPHRGFETVSIAYKGKIAHHDSAGNSGVIEEGDVQWMTAASGVLHKEYHEKEYSKKGGEFHMVQLWVNLPSSDKMSKPKYQSIVNHDISKYYLPNNIGRIEIIAGEHNGIKGLASTFTPVHLMNGYFNEGASETFHFPSNFNTALLVLEGKVKINGNQIVDTDQFALFKNDGETFEVTAMEQSLFLLLSGEPINEPIAAHGPFVMNTRQEIIQAFEDFNDGKFGELAD